MARKLFVTARTEPERERVRSSGAEVLAEYPDTLLVRADEAQEDDLARSAETVPVPDSQVQTAGARFAFDAALAADVTDPVAHDPDRLAYFLVQFVGPTTEEWLAALRARRARLHGALAGFRLIVGALPADAATLADLPFVEAITPYRPAMRISPALRPDVDGRELSTAALASVSEVVEEPQRVEVSVFDGESIQDVAARLRASGAEVLSTSDRHLVAQVEGPMLATLPDLPGVEAILPFDFPQLTNDRAAVVLEAPEDGTVGTSHLTGAGQTVGVADSGIDTGDPATLHPDLAGRVTIVSSPNQLSAQSSDPPPFDDGPADQSAHGTHVAGSVAGNGAAAVAAGSAVVPRGLAPGARLHFTAVGQRVTWIPGAFSPSPEPAPWGLYGLPANLVNLFTPAYAAGARVHTNSWGSPLAAAAGTYNANSRAVDQFLAAHRDMLILYSAGNAGRDNDNDGRIDADSIGPPGTAKNCLTVGASENSRPNGSTPRPGRDRQWVADARWVNFAAAGHMSDNPEGLALFSSRGPTDDGRIKPDVVAPGTNILSTLSTRFDRAYIGQAGPEPLWGNVTPATDPLAPGYCWSGGTSMATPLVAGIAALVRQHLVQQRGHVLDGAKPSGALVKAFIVNGAVPMAGQYAGEIPVGGQNPQNGFGRVSLSGSVAPEPLGTALFSDDPALAVASGQIRSFVVQVLDTSRPLKVTLCWTDPPSPTAVGGLQNTLYLQVVPPGGGAAIDGDLTAFPTATNNTQQVLIGAPIAGDHEIRVRGVNVVTTSAGPGAPAGVVQDFALVVSNAMGLAARPVTIAQAIDTTGSMAFFDYMEPAKARATQLVDFLRSGDRVAIVELSRRSALPDARPALSVRTLTSFAPDWLAARSAIAGLHADGLTPIGAGLQEAFAQISTEAPGRPRGIVLLSDGFNNTPPDPAMVLTGIPADVPIWAVALGPASLSSALSAIAASRPGGAYFSVASDEDVLHLHEIYAALQALSAGMSVLSLASVDVGPTGEVTVDVEAGLPEVVFTVSSDAGGAEGVRVFGPEGAERGVGSEATAVVVGPGHRLVRVGVPKPGRWTVDLAKVDKASRCTVSAAAPSDLRLSATVRPASGGRLVVSAGLFRGTVPIDDATVRASLLIPGRSVDELLRIHRDRLPKVTLPKEVDEPGFKESQRQLLRLSILAFEARDREGGLFERTRVDVDLEDQGGGRYAADVPAAAGGDTRLSVTASGEVEGKPWQRQAMLTARLPTRKPRPVP